MKKIRRDSSFEPTPDGFYARDHDDVYSERAEYPVEPSSMDSVSRAWYEACAATRTGETEAKAVEAKAVEAAKAEAAKVEAAKVEAAAKVAAKAAAEAAIVAAGPPKAGYIRAKCRVCKTPFWASKKANPYTPTCSPECRAEYRHLWG